MNITEGNLSAYVDATSASSLEAMDRSVTQFSSGLVMDRNNAFLPSSAEFAANVRQWDYALGVVTDARSPKPLPHHGVLTIEVGGRLVNVEGTTVAELDFIQKNDRLPEPGELTAITNGENPATVDPATPRLRSM